MARLATGYLNYLFYTRNDGIGIMYDWFKDALIQKVGFVKVWAEEDADDAEQSFEGQTQEQLIMLLQDGWELVGDPTVDAPESGSQVQQPTQPQAQGAPAAPTQPGASGQPGQAQPAPAQPVDPTAGQPTLSFTVRKESRNIAIKVAACPPHEVRIDSNARWGDEPAMIAHVFHKRKFELIEEGYDLDSIGQSGADTRYDTETLEMLGTTVDMQLGPPAPSHELYQCTEMYLKLDADGDGIAEWLRCFLVEETLMEHEKTDGHPFVWACPIPRPHAFFGDCPADQGLGAQKLRTNVIRAIQDNLYLSVNQRTYINTDANVNIADWLENRPGGVVRGSGPASQAIQPLVQPSLGAPAYEFNEWLETWKENRTGFTRYSQGTDANALNHTATGVNIITQKSDARMDLIARFLAVGMKQLFSKLLHLAVKHQKKQDMIKLNDQWISINPCEWVDQFDVKIKVGLGNGSKQEQSARIMGLLQVQQMGVPMGIVGPSQIAETIKLYVTANQFQNPERFVSPQPSGMPPNPQAYQAEQQQNQANMQKLQQQLSDTTAQNQQLTAKQWDRQQELSVKQMELMQNAQIADQKHQHAMAQVSVQATKVAQEGQAKAHDHVLSFAQHDQQALSQVNDQNEASQVADLTQKVDQLTQVVQSMLKQMQPQGQA
jgi:hypothetical protein